MPTALCLNDWVFAEADAKVDAYKYNEFDIVGCNETGGESIQRDSTMPHPNFFIVGAPKCGTTAMHKYLNDHPEVFMSTMKEPNYFNRDLDIDPEWCVRDEREYRELFEAVDGEKCIGEASVWYLYSKDAARKIRRFSPEANILIMLRNPTDMIFSLHRQSLWTCNENIRDFDEALDAEADRCDGKRVPPEARFPGSILYVQVAEFADQVKRYLDVFPEGQVHIVMFDDFVDDTDKVYKDVLRFLDIDSNFKPELVPVNQSKPLILRPINAFLVRYPWLKKASRRLIPVSVLTKLLDALPTALRSVGKPRRMSKATRARLTSTLRPNVKQLEKVIGRDLRDWYH